MGLTTNVSTPCEDVIVNAPDTSNTDIIFSSAMKWGVPVGESLYDVSDDVIFSVDRFTSQPEMYTYIFNVTSMDGDVKSLNQMADCYGHVTELNEEGLYNLNVKATNSLGYHSNLKTKQFRIYSPDVSLTGKQNSI